MVVSLLLIAVFIALFALVSLGLWWFTTPIRQSFTNTPAGEYKHAFVDPSSGNTTAFPSLFDEPTVKLSIIVPAYNEEERIKKMLDDTLAYLKTKDFSAEIIIVDDGSKDKTTAIGLEYSESVGTSNLRVLTLKENQGKGGAVQQGMLHARGELLLMADADAATEIRDLDKLLVAMESSRDSKTGHGIVVGSRAHMEEKSVAKRKWYRSVLMYGFHCLVYGLAVKTVRDTQCGFKLFTRPTARVLFTTMNLRRWCFDVELLHIAEKLKMPIREVPVNWQEIPGSKLRLLEASILMGRDLVGLYTRE
mmetsp:Transcript_11078/g.17517  ORF Transcript_11078/g.17517 Transcript_11078/m.17517 type:complete len:306 (-) Transcript_11078:55-972(-)